MRHKRKKASTSRTANPPTTPPAIAPTGLDLLLETVVSCPRTDVEVGPFGFIVVDDDDDDPVVAFGDEDTDEDEEVVEERAAEEDEAEEDEAEDDEAELPGEGRGRSGPLSS